MTFANGQTVTGREEEIAEYVAAVRRALADVPAAERDELLEDLPAHLAEAAAEDPTPLVQRLGSPSEYAAELRAAATPATTGGRRWRPWAERRERLAGLVRRLDDGAGRPLGYARFSDFGRLLMPGWWVLRGYLAAMVVAILLDSDQQLGWLPRPDGSTIAGLVILAGFVIGSIWLGNATARLHRWHRYTVHTVSAMLLLFGIASLVDIEMAQRWTSPASTVEFASSDPYAYLSDVYVIDEDGRLLTGVQIIDQNGNPLILGRGFCRTVVDHGPPSRVYVDEVLPQPADSSVTYPRCPDQLPFWAQVPTGEPEPSPSGSPSPAPSLSPTPAPDTTDGSADQPR